MAKTIVKKKRQEEMKFATNLMSDDSGLLDKPISLSYF